MAKERISDILNRTEPIPTRKIISKLGVKKSKGFTLSNEEYKIVNALEKACKDGLIEHIFQSGWLLTKKGLDVKLKDS